ncbi:unnamed protein product [Paramecium octaurelia]|uniref:Uncharacterized protein n=1 Tax=Paramecium octaurelia TaxID=43137 RepID=A0A8S1VXB9_PAROT|nr:unnamed protein product [Paramecium octaurelia]
MIPNIYLDQNKYTICGVEIWTPKLVKAPEKLMHKVISTLQNQQQALLEHVNQEERVISLLCSSLAWLQSLTKNSFSSEQSKNLKIVYAYPEENKKIQAEGYLQKTKYRPRIKYYKSESGTAEIKDCDLIFVTHEDLLSCKQESFNNSILIFDNYPSFNMHKSLNKISVKTINNSLVELNKLNNFKSEDTYFLDSQWVELSRNAMEIFKDKLKEPHSDRQKQIKQLLVEQFTNNQQLKKYKKTFNEYANSCQQFLKISNTLKLTSLIDWIKFIEIVQEWDKNKEEYQENYLFVVNQSSKNATLYIYLNYYSQYVLDHLRNLKFQSIIISSKSQFSPQDNFLNKIQIKHKIDQSEYFQTFFIQSKDKYVSLYNTLIELQKNIPNGIVVIFQKKEGITLFKNYCETQTPNNLKEIEKNKILFWGNQKYDQRNFISSQKEGVILFESYEGIQKKSVFKSPNSFQFCNGLILVDMKQPTYYISTLMNVQYFKNRSFNNIIEKVLLQENKNRVLIIFDQDEELQNWMKTCELFQVNCFQDNNPFLFQMIQENFKDSRFNQIQIENEVNYNHVSQNNQQKNLQDYEMEEESDDSSSSQSIHYSIDEEQQ